MKLLNDSESAKKWIVDVFDYKKKRVASIGANGTAKSTYIFKFLFVLTIHRPRTILVTSGTLDQVKKLYEQKLKPLLGAIGFKKSNDTKLEYELWTGTILHFKSSENYKTSEGIEYDWWFADEFQDHSKDAAEMFLKRTRKSREKSGIRIAGLSDDPAHFQYAFFEDNGFLLNELTLDDHPDPDWIKYYDGVLRGLFKGSAFERYRNGARVSLTGTGLFYATAEHCADFVYNPNAPATLVWDFNVEYRAVGMWQEVGIAPDGNKIVACVKSWQMKQATVRDDALALCRELSGHKATIELDGDASGDNRSAAVTYTMWSAIKGVFDANFPGMVRYIVKASNPSVKDTIQCANWALNSGLSYFDDGCKNVYNSVVAAKADKYGEIDKSADYTDNGVKSHETDIFRYAMWRFYGKIYPGAAGKQASKGGALI